VRKHLALAALGGRIPSSRSAEREDAQLKDELIPLGEMHNVTTDLGPCPPAVGLGPCLAILSPLGVKDVAIDQGLCLAILNPLGLKVQRWA